MIIDLHTHTSPLSDDSVIKLPALVQQAKSAGLDGVCLTEHGQFWDREKLERLSREHDFLLLPGVEINTDDGHFLVFGLEKYFPGIWHTEKLREAVDELGGAMILAHPSRRQYHTDEDIETAVEQYCQAPFLKYVDIVEVVNGRSPETANEFSQELCRKLKLKGTGGSDAHASIDIPSGATIFERKVSNVEELITELKAGRFRAVDLRKSR